MSSWDPAGKVDVLDALEMLEIDNLRREGYREARFSCPYPGHENGDQSASAYMNLETTEWFCHGCKRRGNVITFAASMLNVSPIKAKRLLRQAYDPASLNPDERNMIDEVRNLIHNQRVDIAPTNEPFDDAMIERFAVDWEAVQETMMTGSDFVPSYMSYMILRGFEWTTLDYWDFGWDERTKRVTFAVRDEDGSIVGVKGRAPDDRHPKYLVLGDDKPGGFYGFSRYYTGSVVFGMHEVRDQFSTGYYEDDMTEIFVCEGELNAIALWQMGYRNSVALNGSNLTRMQERLIRNYADRVVFYFDPDKAGQEGLWGKTDPETGKFYPGALQRLARDLDVSIVGSHDHDPAQCLEENRESEVERAIQEARPYLVAAMSRSQ